MERNINVFLMKEGKLIVEIFLQWFSDFHHSFDESDNFTNLIFNSILDQVCAVVASR